MAGETDIASLGIKVAVDGGDQSAASLGKVADAGDKADQSLKKVAASSEEGKARLAELSKAADGATESHEKLTKQIATGAAVGILSAESIKKMTEWLVEFGKKSVEAFADAEYGLLKLDTMLSTVAKSTEITTGQVEELGHVIQQSTNYSRDSVITATTEFLKFGSVSKDNLERVTKLTADLAAVTGRDLPAAAELVGRAMESSYGATMLRRLGLLTDGQMEYLKVLRELGNEHRVQEEMLRILEERFGGVAEKTGGQGLAGAWKQLINEIRDGMVDLGGAISYWLQFEKVIKNATDRLKELRGSHGQAASTAAAQRAPPGWPTDLVSQIPTDQSPVVAPQFQGASWARDPKVVAEQLQAQKKDLSELTSMVGSYTKANETLKDVLDKVYRAYHGDADVRAVAIKTFGSEEEAVKKATEAYNARHKAIQQDNTEQMAKSYQSLVNSVLQLSGAEKQRYELDERIASFEQQYGVKLTQDQIEGLKNLLEARRTYNEEQKKTADLEKQRAEDARKADEEFVKAFDTAQKQIDAEKKKYVEITQGKVGLEQYTAAQTAATIAELEDQKAKLGGADADEAKRLRLQTQIDQLKELVDWQNKVAGAQANKEAEKAATESAKKAQKAWDDAAASLSGALADAIMRGFEQGKSFAQNFLDTLKNWFKQTILRPTIEFILSPIKGAVQGLFGGMGQSAAGGLFGGGGFGGAGSIFSPSYWGATGDAVAGLWGGSTGSLVGSVGYYGATGASIGASEAVGISGASYGSSLGATAGGMSALGAVGIAAAIGFAVYSYLKSKEGGPKTEGYAATGNVDLSGTGYTDNGRWMTGTGQDATIAKGLKDVKDAYTAWVKNLGGTAAAEFAQGWSMDPKGSAPSNVHTGVWVGGQNVYNAANPNVGRSQEELDAEIALQTKQALLAALQHSDLPKAISDYLNTVEAASATADQIDSMLQMADAMAAVWKMTDPLKDAMDAFATSTEGAMKNLARMRTALLDQAKAFDGSAESATQLASATQEFYNAAVQTLAQIESMKKQIGEGFGQQADRYRLATMNSQQQYEWYQLQVSKLEKELQTTTDAQRIGEIASLISQYQGAAFGTLGPEQQKALGESFARAAEYANELVQAQLKKAGDIVEKDTKDTVQAIKDTLSPPAKDLKDASKDLKEAAENLNRVSSTPIQIELDVTDRGTGTGRSTGRNVTGGA